MGFVGSDSILHWSPYSPICWLFGKVDKDRGSREFRKMRRCSYAQSSSCSLQTTNKINLHNPHPASAEALQSVRFRCQNPSDELRDFRPSWESIDAHILHERLSNRRRDLLDWDSLPWSVLLSDSDRCLFCLTGAVVAGLKENVVDSITSLVINDVK